MNNALAPQFVQTTIARHPEQPGLQRLARAQIGKRNVELGENLLENVRSRVVVIEKAANEIEQRATITLHEFFKSFLISCQGLLRQNSIGNLNVLALHAFSQLHRCSLLFLFPTFRVTCSGMNYNLYKPCNKHSKQKLKKS